MRLSLFIDYQNAFEVARESFHRTDSRSPRASDGQVDPLLLGTRMCRLQTAFRPDGDVVLHEVRVYRGRPRRNHPSYRPWQRQVSAWERAGVNVVTRPLRGRGRRAREKGIDVSLALDFYSAAISDQFDIGVLFSMDFDLAPALERAALDSPETVIEAAGWNRTTRYGPQSIVDEAFARRHRIWRHRLQLRDYLSVRDATNYTLPIHGQR